VSRARRHLVALLVVIASLLAAAGCVSVPTSGPIEEVKGQQPPCQNCVNVEVAPPASGDEPKQIVEGYLRATSNYQPNYSVARQFLTQMAAEKWSPEEVSIYRGSLHATNEATVNLTGRLVGSLAKDRTYTAEDQALSQNFGLKEENGEWRIDTLPSGLWVDEFYFTRFYQTYDLYFVGNGPSLVPDPIYLPVLRNPANVASALMKALINGPSRWLKPAVSTALPPNTTLSVDSVTITDGIAEVPLSDSVLALPDPQRRLLAAQIVYTLKQVGGLKGVLIKVNQQPYRVPTPEGDPNSLVISVDAISRDMDPIPFVAGEHPYAVQQGAVTEVVTSSDPPTVRPLARPLGGGAYDVDALAVSATNTDLAFTTNNRTTLRLAPIAEEEPTTLLGGVRDLLRPQFTRYGEIWDIGRQGGRQQRIWVFTADKSDPNSPTTMKTIAIDSPVLRAGNVTAFKISPDGTRMVMVRSTKAKTGIGTGSELLLARIIRADNKIMVDGWRLLDTTQTNMQQIDRIADVAWLDATELMVLGAARTDAAYAPFRVVEDASQISKEGEPENWNAIELAVLPRTQSAIIVGTRGQTWKDNGSQWVPFVDKVSTIAYPG
jgi:Lipoprotein LpqB beta-propeller domain/Sporulation and spore germination